MGKVESKVKDAFYEIESMNVDIRYHEWINLNDGNMSIIYPESEIDCEKFAVIVQEQPPSIEFLEVG